MKSRTRRSITVCLAVLFAAPSVFARDQIRIVGSSTVFPFSAAVAEQFGRSTTFKTPIVESTGSGGGLKLFCAGRVMTRRTLRIPRAESKPRRSNSAQKMA